MDARRIKAHDLADRARIYERDGVWHVPSQSGAGWYKVIVDDRDAVCECPDHELTGKACKHIMAVRLVVSREVWGTKPKKPSTEPSPK
jgi:hypothetical protein